MLLQGGKENRKRHRRHVQKLREALSQEKKGRYRHWQRGGTILSHPCHCLPKRPKAKKHGDVRQKHAKEGDIRDLGKAWAGKGAGTRWWGKSSNFHEYCKASRSSHIPLIT